VNRLDGRHAAVHLANPEPAARCTRLTFLALDDGEPRCLRCGHALEPAEPKEAAAS